MKELMLLIMFFAAMAITAPAALADPVPGMGDEYEAPEIELNSPVVENLIAIGTFAGIALVAAKNPRRQHVGND